MLRLSPPILELGSDFYDPVTPAAFPQHRPRYLNYSACQNLGLQLQDEDWILHFAKFAPLAENLQLPLALRYHGHQFQHYNPQLGDGRGFLFAQFSVAGKILDLGTKGSGQTPYSRDGDGRLTLKGAFREALATEMLESLGVNTSKTFCFFETGENLVRTDEPSPTRAAVLTRLNHSHIRFGTFERLAYLNQPENIDKLTKYCVRHYYQNCDSNDSLSCATLFFRAVMQNSAILAAQWMIAGFVHGVLNTDNMNITGESFDYGPFRFLPKYDPNFTAAYFDRAGLYCYGHQPSAVHWNLQRLGECLLLAYPGFPNEEILQDYEEIFNRETTRMFFQRLNLNPKSNDGDIELLVHFFSALEKTQAGFEQAFFNYFGGRTDRPIAGFEDFAERLKNFQIHDEKLCSHSYFAGDKPCTLIIDELENIWETIASLDDWSLFQKKLQQIRAFRGIYSL